MIFVHFMSDSWVYCYHLLFFGVDPKSDKFATAIKIINNMSTHTLAVLLPPLSSGKEPKAQSPCGSGSSEPAQKTETQPS